MIAFPSLPNKQIGIGGLVAPSKSLSSVPHSWNLNRPEVILHRSPVAGNLLAFRFGKLKAEDPATSQLPCSPTRFQHSHASR